MFAADKSMEGVLRLGPIAALAGVALVFIAGRLLFWSRHFLRRDDRSSTHPARHLEALAASGRRMVLIEWVASLAAAVGLLATYLDLRNGTGAGISTDAERLSLVFAPALAGLGVFVLCEGALGLFRSWGEALKTETVFVPPAPVVLPPDILRPSEGAPPLRRPRRPAAPPARPSARDTFWRVAVLSTCMLGSILLHAAILYIAHRVQTSPVPPREGERAGMFLARIVHPPQDPVPPALEIREPAPPPPKPPPVHEPPPVEAPKAETPEPAALTERPKPEPSPEKAKPEAPPSPPPVAEAREPEPEPRTRSAEAKEAKEAKEAERPQPAAAAPPAPKVTESSTAGKEPAAAEPPAPPAPAAPSKAGADPVVLGFGDPSKAREKEEPSTGSDPRTPAAGIASMKEYRRFLAREMKSGAAEGQYVPNLRFGDNKAQENREIMRYFGMELIAYPKNQKFYVYIDPDQSLFSRSNDFGFIRNFSSRAIFRTSPYFDTLRVEAARRIDVPADSLVVAQLLKPSSAAYIGWKEAECARRAGVPLDGVDACDASFVKTPFGVWIVRIDRLLLKDGRTLTVEDFEWTKVSSAGGGER